MLPCIVSLHVVTFYQTPQEFYSSCQSSDMVMQHHKFNGYKYDITQLQNMHKTYVKMEYKFNELDLCNNIHIIIVFLGITVSKN